MRRLRWPILAALLLAATALLFALGEGDPPLPPRAPVRYPEWFSGEQWQRQEARETLDLPAPPAAPPAPGAPPAPPPPRRDPFLVALPVKPDSPVVVFEANALRHSLLGERFLACLEARKPGDLADLQKQLGIDPLKDIDRVGYTDDAVVISGFFQHLRLDQEYRAPPERYGEAGRVYHQESRPWLATWRDQILVVADTREGVQRAVDQLEGRVPVPASALSEDMAYGEVYGVVPGSAARKLLAGADDRGIGQRLGELAQRVELHVDAMQDVAAVVRVKGSDAAGLEDLGRSMGAALALARVKAQAEGNQELAELLESALVRPAGAELSLQLAVPAAQLEKWFEGCGGRSGTASPATAAPEESPATQGR
jgi:hypothetical protein